MKFIYREKFFIGLVLFLLITLVAKWLVRTDVVKISLTNVEAARVIKKDVKQIINLPANTISPNIIKLQSQVSGQVMKVAFKDGQKVNLGDILYIIDDRNYKNLLSQSQANLAKDQAQLVNATEELERYKALAAKKFATAEQVSAYQSNVDSLKASIEGDNSAIKNSQLELEYTIIKSPINGVASENQVDVGNLVQANSTHLVSINQISPIDISFEVAEQYIDRMRQKNSDDNLKFIIKSKTGENIGSGQIDFIDNAINTNSGSIKVKGSFENHDDKLWPGEVVYIDLILANKKDALVVPLKAIENNQSGPYVFVVNKDQSVEIRNVKIDFYTDAEAIIQEGLKENEVIVTSGRVKLRSGSKVEAIISEEKF